MLKRRMRISGLIIAIGLLLAFALIVIASCSSGTTTSTTPTSTTQTTSTSSTTTTIGTLSSISIAPAAPDSSAKLGVGAKQQFTATGTYSSGSTNDISSQVSWSSSDNAVASVDSSGMVTGVVAGTGKITASQSGVTSKSSDVTILAYTSIAVTPDAPADLPATYPIQFTAIGITAEGTKADITSQVSWASSNTAAATIDAAGLATGVAAGNSDITASLPGGVTGAPVKITMTPEPPKTTTTTSTATSSTSTGTSPGVTTTAGEVTLSSMAVTPSSITANIEVGGTLQFTATGTYSDGTTKDISSEVAWTSSDNIIATISAKGLAAGVTAGMCDIKASLFGKTSPAVSLLVMTPVPTLSSISIESVSPDNSANLTSGTSQRFIATGSFADGSSRDISSVATWSSSSSTVATVDTNGLVTGVMAGTTDITASRNGKTSQAIKVTVVAAPTTTTTATSETTPAATP